MRPINRISHRLRSLSRRPRLTQTQIWVRRGIIGALALGVWVGGSYWLWSTGRVAATTAALDRSVASVLTGVGLAVQDVSVRGRLRTSDAELQRVMEKWLNHSLLQVDLESTREKLERLPWVKSAAIRRELPDRLVVEIREHEPLAIWQERPSGRPRLVDDSGAVVEVTDLRPYRNLRQVSGIEAPGKAKALFEILDKEPELAKRITVASLIGKRRWDLLVDGRVVVRLPEQGVAEAWQRLARHERKSRLLERTIDVVDLRHEEWLVLRTMDEPGQNPTRQGRGA